MENFNASLACGKIGEEMVAAALKKNGNIVLDVSSCRDYQNKDIDFLVSKDKKKTTLEVKNDRRSEETGNVYIEIYNANNASRNNAGWFFYCEAAYLAFVQENRRIAHIISRRDIIDLCESNSFPIRDMGNISSGYTIPIAALQRCRSYYKLNL